MSVFGWSYPPGCSGPPDEGDHPCEVCGLFPDDCLCQECPQCGACGDPGCYPAHGMIRSQEQIESLAAKEKEWAAANKAEADFWAEWEAATAYCTTCGTEVAFQGVCPKCNTAR